MPDDPRRTPPRAHTIQNALVGVALLAELIVLLGHLAFGWGPKAPTQRPTPPALVFRARTGAEMLNMLAALAAGRRPTAPSGAPPRCRRWRLPVPGRAPDADPGPAIPFLALTARTCHESLSPAAEAMALRALARLPGLVDEGVTVDRAGRSGVGISLLPDDGDPPLRYTLVFDPLTGALHELDETLAGRAGRLRVRDGAPIAYTVVGS